MIQKAKKEDIVGIVKLHLYLIKHLHRVNPKRYNITSKEKTNFLKEINGLLINKDSLVVVYKDKEKIAGYAIGKIKQSPLFLNFLQCGELYEVVVSDKYQKKGIGRELIKQIINFFKNRKVKIVELLVDSKNRVAMDAWKKLGFQEELKIMKKMI